MNLNDIYIGQTRLDILVNTYFDLTGASTALIKYRKPSGTAGQWTATIEDTAKGILKYTIQNSTTIDEAGTWVIWSHVTYPDTTILIGKPTDVLVKNEGQI